jgi:Uma2 family endonuclease
LQARENDLLPSQPKPNTTEQLPMNISTKLHYFSPEEYLELERHSPFRHEYQRGLVYAMAGGKKSHGQITSNLNMLLGSHLANTPCSVYVADMKVNIAIANCYYYPDISVTCDEKDRETNNDFIIVPQLIVEVLSSSTEAFDRGDKFLDYQQLSSLQEYILVSQNKMQVECYRKQPSGEWHSQCYGNGEIVEIESVHFKCAIAQIYHKVLGLT